MIELVGDELYQWDVGRKVKITPKRGYTISCVHFNDGSDDSLTMVNGVATARIPDELLQQCGSVTVYAVSTKEGGIETTESRQFYIKKKTKPTGYTHVPTEVATINSAITAATQAQASANEAKGYRDTAWNYANNASDSATKASTSEGNANTYKVAAEKAKNEILGNGGTYTNPTKESALKEIRSAKTEIVGTTGTAKSPNDNSALKEIRNTKTEILGETGTYSDPNNKSALKEIRDFTATNGPLAQAKGAAKDAADSRDAIRSIESNMNTAVEAAGKIDSFRSEITTYHTETKNARNDILSKGADGEKSVYEKIIDAETSIIGSGGTVADPKEGSALKATKDAQKAAAQSAKEAKEAATSANQGIKVVDDLNDTSTSNALSANKGKVLNDSKLDKSGGEMTGALSLSADPTEDKHAATKLYVDTHMPSVVTESKDGVMSAADKIKLNGIEAGANKTTIVDNLTSNSAESALSANQGKVLDKKIEAINVSLENLGAGDMLKSVYDTNNNGKVDDADKLNGKTADYYAEATHGHNVATQSADGFLSSADKKKLDGLENALAAKVNKEDGKGLSTNDFTTDEKKKLAGLENYTLPTASDTVKGGIKVGAGLTMNGEVLSATGGGTADAVDWSNVTNKPETFAPSTHTHTASEVTELATVATSGSYNDLSDKPTDFAPAAHTHEMTDITGLSDALDGKSDTTHNHDGTYLKPVDVIPSVTQGSTSAVSSGAVYTQLSGLKFVVSKTAPTSADDKTFTIVVPN